MPLKAADRAALRKAADDSLDLLRQDAKRLKALLRNIAGLIDEVSMVLIDADHEKDAQKIRLVSKTLRGAALLPAVASIAIARKLLDKALPAPD